MNNIVGVSLLSLLFFTFLIDQVSFSYDRAMPQFLFLGILNFLIIAYFFTKFSLRDLIDNSWSSNIFKIYSIYFLISIISIIIADNKISSLITISQYSCYFLCFFLILNISSKISLNFKNVFLALVVVSTFIESLAVIYSVLDVVITNGQFFERGNDFRGFSGNINLTAFSLTIKAPIIYYLIYTQNSKKYIIIFLTSLFTLSLAIFFLLTRGAFIAFAIITLIILSYKLIKLNRRSIIGSSLIVLTLALSFSLASNVMSKENSNIIVDRVSSVSISSDDNSIRERLRFYKAAISSIKENPLLGVGVGNWKIKSIKYDRSVMADYTVPYYAHNDFLQVAAEIGIVGAFFYLVFIFSIPVIVLRKILNKEEDFFDIILLSMFVVFIIDSMLNFPIGRPITHIFMIFMTCMFINKNRKSILIKE